MRKWLITMSAVMFATAVAAQTLPSPTFGGATVKKATTPSIMLDSATTDTSINSIFGQRQGANQWRLGLGGSSGFFQVERYVGGVPMDNPLAINNATGETTVTGRNFRVLDAGRTSQTDNSPAMDLTSTEGVGYPSYVTNYGLIVNRRMTATGKGDRIGGGFYQTCDATLAGKSCVGTASVSVAGGAGVGGYTGGNSIVKVPPGLTGPASAAVGLEVDTQTHSPVGIKNGLRIADENMYNQPSVAGSVEDAAIAIVTSNFYELPNHNLGYNVGIQFGEADQGYPQNWPIRANGTLIQGNNPNVRLDYGIDLKGSTSGFNGAAIALPVNSTNNNLTWGNNKQGGSIASTATSAGPLVTFTDNGFFVNNGIGNSLFAAWNDGRLQAPLQTPASSTAACQVGQFMNDANFHYVCVAANSWKRAALSAW
ncbi:MULTISPECIES: hypothetical protein [unclassified Rhizobium]|uniref:hypothetical protein n=1 Tax=unclassified Rhizobium TaxID=2613769 RepID=UPI00288B00B0|nr:MULTISPECIES: hypothetical protein [unclassified Rhizobium]